MLIINADELKVLVTGIVSCLSDPSRSIREKAADTLTELFKPDFIQKWDGSNRDWRLDPPEETITIIESSIKVYWKISSLVLLLISRQVIELRGELIDQNGISLSNTKPLLSLINEILSQRLIMFKKRLDAVKPKDFVSYYEAFGLHRNTCERVCASVSLEMCLLISICCFDLDVSNLAVSCINHMLCESDFLKEFRNDEDNTLNVLDNVSITENYNVYNEIRKLGSTSFHLTGQKALQKRLRKLFRLASKSTPGNMGAWDEIYGRWKILSGIHITPISNSTLDEDLDLGKRKKGFIGRSQQSSTLEFIEDKGDWQNYTGLLATLGGVCLSNGPSPPARKASLSSSILKNQSSMQQPPWSIMQDQITVMTNSNDNASSNWNNSSSQILMNSFTESKQKVDSFLAEMVELTICDNILVREAVKDLLGNELNSLLYGLYY